MENKRVSVGDIVYVLIEGEWALAKVMQLNEGTTDSFSIKVMVLQSQGFRSVMFMVSENEYLTFEEKEKL